MRDSLYHVRDNVKQIDHNGAPPAPKASAAIPPPSSSNTIRNPLSHRFSKRPHSSPSTSAKPRFDALRKKGNFSASIPAPSFLPPTSLRRWPLSRAAPTSHCSCLVPLFTDQIFEESSFTLCLRRGFDVLKLVFVRLRIRASSSESRAGPCAKVRSVRFEAAWTRIVPSLSSIHTITIITAPLPLAFPLLRNLRTESESKLGFDLCSLRPSKPHQLERSSCRHIAALPH